MAIRYYKPAKMIGFLEATPPSNKNQFSNYVATMCFDMAEDERAAQRLEANVESNKEDLKHHHE